ncbi:MAG: hypothetical protein CMJ18_28355 [Phycisphaeraceae bacterium]|nr:hypothetical protein [Phycisphaeraceae bacterium]
MSRSNIAGFRVSCVLIVLAFGLSPCADGDNVIHNGSFETGNFTGWMTEDIPNRPNLNVRSGGTPGFGLFTGAPTDGTFFASHNFDGSVAGLIRFGQDVVIPRGTATLDFDWRAGWDFRFGGTVTEPRTFNVNVEPFGGGATLHSFSILTTGVGPQVNLDTGVQSESLDMNAFTGQAVRLNFDALVPQALTGPGHMLVDHIRLNSNPVIDINPAFSVQEVGSPSWQPVDFHTTSGPGTSFEAFLDTIHLPLPEPNHRLHPDLGVGPGDPHDPLYDQELGQGLANSVLVETTTFTPDQFTLTNDVVVTMFMVVPRGGAPIGSSPDFASGPIIPNSLFPIVADVTIERADATGEPFLPFDSGQSVVPPLDGSIDPPLSVDGHSHFPLFGGDALEFGPAGTNPVGVYRRTWNVRDQQGHGWDIVTAYEVVPEPAAVCFSGFGALSLLCRRRRGGIPTARSRRTGWFCES